MNVASAAPPPDARWALGRNRSFRRSAVLRALRATSSLLALTSLFVVAAAHAQGQPPDPPPPEHVPRLAILTFRGPAEVARAAEIEIVRAFEQQSEIEVVRADAFKQRVVDAGVTLRRGWSRARGS